MLDKTNLYVTDASEAGHLCVQRLSQNAVSRPHLQLGLLNSL